ncbi:hypothetical protein HNQ59_003643 [Chitinivorax tropicus]|uniref:Ricin B lectin domain-containing protein n=1 Tax=Chitinivorax tropicus TaxID=714531 RepID=A0A840MMF1_9PROT|nr:ricin-type beta-trefoil lectin domain protein [Chitinivorax tropicus]MBB5020324.1 hypothetical protein [Chitinivorax tropicus]
MKPQPPLHQDALPDEPFIRQAYQALPQAEPSTALDAAILQAAQASIDAPSPATVVPLPTKRRWYAIPLATAATVVLGLGMLLEMQSAKKEEAVIHETVAMAPAADAMSRAERSQSTGAMPTPTPLAGDAMKPSSSPTPAVIDNPMAAEQVSPPPAKLTTAQAQPPKPRQESLTEAAPSAADATDPTGAAPSQPAAAKPQANIAEQAPAAPMALAKQVPAEPLADADSYSRIETPARAAVSSPTHARSAATSPAPMQWQSVSDKRCLAVINGQVSLAPCQATPEQLWQPLPGGQLQNVATQHCLASIMRSATPDRVSLVSCTDTAELRWRITDGHIQEDKRNPFALGVHEKGGVRLSPIEKDSDSQRWLRLPSPISR